MEQDNFLSSSLEDDGEEDSENTQMASCSTQDVENQKEENIRYMTSKLLSNKEKLAEQFMLELLDTFQKKHGEELGFSADLSFQEKIVKAEKKMNECSMILAHKYQPIIREVIAQQAQQHMDDKYGIIKAKPSKEEDWSKQYRKCFLSFLFDEDCVSLKAENKDLLKNLNIRHYFTLVFWAMNTCKRQAGDNLLQLVVCGKTSCGKSAIFENPLQEISHNLTGDDGCGRFLTQSKSTLLLHDCNLECLVKGKDVDKLKSITRTEPISTKVHSKTNSVPPMFVMCTSNKHMYLHRFKTPKKEGYCSRTIYKSDLQATKHVHEADIEAVRNRYVECFVRDRPVLPPGALPSSGNFKRTHAIKGLFTYIIDILNTYVPDDFSSEYLFLYALIGLCKNLWMMEELHQNPLEQFILKLLDKYDLDDDQKHQCWISMKQNSAKKEEM